MTTLRDTETTNILLLLILVVLLAGFGFITPILWVFAGVVGLWLILKLLGAIASGISAFVDTVENFLGQIFAPVWKVMRAFLRNDAVQWLFLLGAACGAVWFNYATQQEGYLAALIFLALIALFKLISRWDKMMAKRKYGRNNGNDA